MRKFTVMASACVIALAVASSAQQAGSIQAAATALGAGNLRSIQVSGAGNFFVVVQSFSPDAPWPRFNLRTYTADVNYDTAAMRVDLVRTQYENPPRGGGNQPLVGEQRQILVVRGATAWNVPPPQAAPGAAPAAPQPQPQATADERMLQMYLTPHGFLKGAMANNATTRAAGGGTEATFMVGGKHRVVGTINARNEVERVQTWIPNDVLGDMPYEAEYSNYRDFNGVRFPARIVLKQGGHPTFEITVSAVQPNAPVDIAVPDAVRSATIPPPRVDVEKIADGVHYLTGGSHHSVAIEMRDHVVVVEGPQNEQRASAVIAKTRELIPNKPIRFVVNTHHHFDHSGGLRTFVDEGITVVTHQINRPFYEKAWALPRTLSPDRLAQSRRRATFQTFTDRHVLTDGTRNVELHHIAGNGHNAGIVMAYLPRERVLVEADVFTVNAPNAPVPATPNAYAVNLYENIQRLKLDVGPILGLHGRATDMAELRRLIGRAGSN